MNLKLFLIFIMGFVFTTIMLLTGTIVPFLLVIKSFLFFVGQLIILLFLIWLFGNGLLFALAKWKEIRERKKKEKKLKKKPLL